MTDIRDGEASQLARALALLEKSRARIEDAEQERFEPIAVVGVGCRLPGGVKDLSSLWELLSSGRDAVTEIPESRWRVSGSYDANPEAPGKIYTRAMGVLENATLFDNEFFGISAREAESMDPQHRVLLEVCAEALDSSGADLEKVRNAAAGVFVGISSNEFSSRADQSKLDMYAATGRALSTAAGRISYVFGLRGPAIAIDTACSSSLVALHLACQSLRRRESDVALAAGVSVTAGPEGSVALSKLRALSPTGRCHTFSRDADGCVRGEGCGAVVLKRLSDARANGDRILALIRSTGVNQDGRSNGFTAPNRRAQEELLRTVLDSGRLAPNDVAYVEAHGTGTALGDPIELGALDTVYGPSRAAGNPLLVGSLKTNIGHLEAAAGIAGLLKCILILKHGQIPASLHFGAPNPLADWDSGALRVPTELSMLESSSNSKGLVGVSSFGFSGTNAHAILERAESASALTQPVLAGWLPVSARGELALRARARQVAGLVAEHPEQLAAICESARQRIASMPDRIAVRAQNSAEVARSLDAFARGERSEDVQHNRASVSTKGTVLVFSGQGGQWVGMGRELLERSDAFRQTLSSCDRIVSERYGWSILAQLSVGDAESRLAELPIVQPVLFALSVGIARHVLALGLRVDAMLGHSMGEVAAAHVAGALSLEDALLVICERSQLLAGALGGAMAVIDLGEAEIQQILSTRTDLSIAATNGPRTTILSGPSAAITRLLVYLDAKGVLCREVASASCASHSPDMDRLVGPLTSALRGISPLPPQTALYSTVTTEKVDGTLLGAAYWGQNLREQVRFRDTISRIAADGYSSFLELSPHPVLTLAVRETLEGQGMKDACVVPVMRRGESEERTIVEAVGALYTHGAPLCVNSHRREFEFPAYPWQHQEFSLPAAKVDRNSSGHAFLGTAKPSSAKRGLWTFEGSIPSDHAFVRDHRAGGAKILPGAAYLEMASWAAAQLWPERSLELVGIEFLRALTFGDDEQGTRVVELEIVDDGTGSGRFRVCSRDDDSEDWYEHARGSVRESKDASTPLASNEPLTWLEQPTQRCESSDVYALLDRAGLNYGESFRRVKELWSDGERVVVSLESGVPQSYSSGHLLAAEVLDAALHGAAWLRISLGASAAVPASVERFRLVRKDLRPTYALARVARIETLGSTDSQPAGRVDVQLVSDDGSVVAEILGLQSVEISRADEAVASAFHSQSWLKKPLVTETQPKSRSWLVLGSPECSAHWLDTLSRRLPNCSLVRTRFASELQVKQEILGGLVGSCGFPDEVLIIPPGVCDGELEGERGVAFLACVAVLRAVQAILGLDTSRLPGVSIVTRASQLVSNEDRVPTIGVELASVWGLARSLSVEHPALRCRCIDLPIRKEPDEIEPLIRELCFGAPESEVALRADRWVGRLRSGPCASAEKPKSNRLRESFRAELDRPGILGSVVLRERARRSPGAGQVELRVRAAALNFADVMHGMGFFGEGRGNRPVPLGSECVGEIVRVGHGVTRWQVGQVVVALAEHCFGSHVLASVNRIRIKPPTWTDEEAASLPIAAMTAHLSLVELARMTAGESVLIHSATGGTGLAALQVARSVGAEVFATAGTDEKREYLKQRGVKHVFDSRRLDFADEILSLTSGRGVDVVLNSLTGPALERSLSVLAKDGRFLELGKRDIYEGTSLPLEYFKKRISFTAVDLGGLERERPERFEQLFHRVMDFAEAGRLSPAPISSFPITRVSDALLTMSSAQHIGKLVLSVVPLDPSQVLSGDITGTHVITGGLGGLGLKLAEWLVENGATGLLLLGRSEPSESALDAVNRFRDRGVFVDIARVDANNAAAVLRVLTDVRNEQRPIRGVFHLAAVLEDGLVANQTAESFARVLDSKLGGAWALHDACSSLNLELDHFVLYSSAAALLPSPAQANYSAANAALDALAAHRRSRGLPAISLQWGPFSDAGRVSGRASERIADRGSGTITTGFAHRVLRGLLAEARQPTTVGVFPFELARWLEFNPAMRSVPRFELLKGQPSERSDDSQELQARLKNNDPPARLEALRELVSGHLTAVLRRRASLPDDSTFQQLGLDSLTGLELRNRLENSLGLKLSATLLWRHPTVAALATHLLDRLFPDQPSLGDSGKPSALVNNSGSESWFLTPKRTSNPQGRLFCFPYLGGLPAVFSPWAKRLAPGLEMRVLQVPGRPPRTGEAPFDRLAPLVEGILTAMEPLMDRPYAFYGHSLGALTAYEVARAIDARGGVPPRHLFLAAYPAPDQPNPVRGFHDLPLDQLATALSGLGGIPSAILEDSELLAMFLPSIRADLAIVAKYEHAPREPLAVPTTVFCGKADHMIPLSHLEGWSEHVTPLVTIETVPGGHLFVREAERELIARINAEFAKWNDGRVLSEDVQLA